MAASLEVVYHIPLEMEMYVVPSGKLCYKHILPKVTNPAKLLGDYQ